MRQKSTEMSRDRHPNILILSSHCFSDCTANGICGINLYDAFKEMNLNTHILGFGDSNSPEIGQHSLYPSEVKEHDNAFFQSVVTIVKPRMNKSIVDGYMQSAEKIIREYSIDMVVSMVFPLETLVAANKLKNKYPSIFFIAFELDSATDFDGTSIASKLVYFFFRRWMRITYKNLDRVIIMRCHEKHVKKRFERFFLNKFLYSDFPVLVDKGMIVNNSDDICIVLYEGTLYSSFRSPLYLLQVFQRLNQVRLQLHFFSGGDCELMIESYCDGEKIFQHGLVSQNRLLEWEKKANILVNIGNKNMNSLPSKLITYMSLGKPIIHISNSDNDMCLKYLEKYPFSLIIKETDDVGESIRKIKNFINETKNEIIPYQRICQIYKENTPSYNAQLILDSFMRRKELG